MARREAMHAHGILVAGAVVLSLSASPGCCPWARERRARASSDALLLMPRHTPLSPDANQSVKLSLEVTAEVSKVSLRVFRYDLPPGDPGHPDLQACERVRTWKGREARELTTFEWTAEGGFSGTGGAGALVAYEFEVETADGWWTTTTVAFAVGEWPWPEFPVPLYRQGDETAPRRGQIDLCFVPDGDYEKNWTLLRSHLEDLVYDGYFGSDAIRARRDLWSFFYTLEEGDASKLRVGVNAETKFSEIDAFGILHTSILDDLRTLAIFTSEGAHKGTAVHESGHAIFDLSDEYPGGGTPTGENDRWNLFEPRDQCEAHNTSHGWPAGDCRLREASGPWLVPEPASSCIMAADGDANLSQFGRSCSLRIHSVYDDF